MFAAKLADMAADTGRTCKRDDSRHRMLNHIIADLCDIIADHIENTFRKSCLFENIGNDGTTSHIGL
ncbi:hypothetical protein D3C85_1760260 [compost metagenome]